MLGEPSFSCFGCQYRSYTGCPADCQSRPRYYTYRVTVDTAGARWVSKFEAGVTGPIESWREKSDPDAHFFVDALDPLL